MTTAALAARGERRHTPPPEAPAAAEGYVTAMLNILEDFAEERGRLGETQRAVLNILEDTRDEKDQLAGTQRAVLNILDDVAEERAHLGETQRAVLNILEDANLEKERLEHAQRAVLNILEDFEVEKVKVEAANEDLRREVRERAEAERALTSKTEELARSNAELEQFAYVASHDLQEPLRMVTSYMQLFERRYRGQFDAQADKYIGYAVEGSQRMRALIAGLLEYSRAARVEVAQVEVDSEAALREAVENLRRALEETEGEVTHGALPRVRADGAQLAQVFQNLIGNALKFRRPGFAPRVHVSAERSGGEYVFSVEDNGIGIEAQFAERIFVIFQRLHARTEYPGTGIGLSICKKVIVRNGGRIWVESEVGHGSDFRFTLAAAGAGDAGDAGAQ